MTRLHPWLALALLVSLGTGLAAQDPPEDPEATPAPAPTLPPLPAPRGDAAPVDSARDPFHSRVLAPPPPPGQQAARAPQAIRLLGTVRVPGRSSCAVLRLGEATFVVRAGDRLPLASEGEDYLEVRAVEDGWLEVESGRVKWVLR